MSATNVLGRVGIVLRGEYDSAANYKRLDVVTHEHCSYVATQDVSGIAPPNAAWQPLADVSDLLASAATAIEEANAARDAANKAAEDAEAAFENAVLFTAQEKPDAEKAIARRNIGAASVDDVGQLSEEIADFKNATTVVGKNLLEPNTMVEIGVFLEAKDGKAIKTANQYTENYGIATIDISDLDYQKVSFSAKSNTLARVNSVFITDANLNIIDSRLNVGAFLPFTISDFVVSANAKYLLFDCPNYKTIYESYPFMVNIGDVAEYEDYQGLRFQPLRSDITDDLDNRLKVVEDSLDTLNPQIRKAIYVSSADSEIVIADKMLLAFNTGKCDVFFEKGTYTLSEVYAYLISKGMKSTAVGLPVGNGCRYYFNGSTIVSNTPSNGFDEYRNVLDSCWMGSDYEVYDATLINNGGRYCVHDEGASDDTPYTHKYSNVKMYTRNSSVLGSKPFGCGTGFDTTILFDGCEFVRDNENDVCIAIHGATTNPDNLPQVLSVGMKNCYVSRANIAINKTYFDVEHDTLNFFLFGNKFQYAFSDVDVNLIENNNSTI
jgi:hypothetical protein